MYWVASMTKLVTAVAITQLVERGVLSLDEDVRKRVPELANIQILKDMKEGSLHLSTITLGGSISYIFQINLSFCPYRGR